MARIYTRQGDDGTSRLFDGTKVPKHHVRLEAYGTLDELNSYLGVARAATDDDDIDVLLARLQAYIFDVGADLADPNATGGRLTDDDIRWAEGEIDRAMAECPPLDSFVLPAGAPCAAHLHVARTVCRRAERWIAALAEETDVPPRVMAFVNRLSDLLFALARLANERAGVEEVRWKPRGGC